MNNISIIPVHSNPVHSKIFIWLRPNSNIINNKGTKINITYFGLLI